MNTTDRYFTIDELPLETRGHLIRDVACSVFFGYYDNRQGYINDNFKKGGVNLQGIYSFFDTIKNASQILTEYHNENYDKYVKYDDTKTFDEKFGRVFWKHHPYSGFDFTNLINDFHSYLKYFAKKYGFILNDDFYEEVVPGALEEINILCEKFIPDIENDYYNIKEFRNKYITAVNMTYGLPLLLTMSQLFKSKYIVYNYELDGSDIYQIEKRNRSTLYATQTYEYDNNGEIEKITTKILDKFGGKVLIRYRDTFI